MATSKKREKQIEARVVQRTKEHGGIAFKFTSPGRRSVPDRLIAIPCWNDRLPFVEAKAPGATPTDAQLREHERIRKVGGTVYVIDGYGPCDELFASKCNGKCLL